MLRKQGKPQTVCLTMLLMILLLPSMAGAFILEGSHILYRTAKELGTPKSLSVFQDLLIYDPANPEEPTRFQESLTYDFPDQYRSDITGIDFSKIYIFSNYNTITIINEKTASTAEDLLEYDKDLLLLRDRSLMESRLIFFGIDITLVSLGRFQDHHYFVIGARYPDETRPQVWIDKETFLPKRLLILDQSDPVREKIVEFRYAGWTKKNRIYYPIQIETYQDNQLLRSVQVHSVQVNPDLPEDFFDIERLKNDYPPIAPDPYQVDETDDLEDVQQSIKEFKSRFE